MISVADRYSASPEAISFASERPLLTVPRRLSELELQAHWFAGNFGRDFTTADGDTVRIVQFGVWNREAGPDFADAAISINGVPALRGCIELDPDARDWERHGHAENPEYEKVILHVCLQSGSTDFFARTLSHRFVPRVLLDLTRLTDEPLNPVPEAKLGRCVAPLRDLTADKVSKVLLGAARFRVRRKAAALLMLRELHGADEALYQALAATLGYKNNKLPFTLLAQRLGLATLLKAKDDADALVFGVSGFLNAPTLRDFEAPTRLYLRGLWEKWWPRRADFARLVVAPQLWNMGGQRPTNHPQRRLAALVQMTRHWAGIRALRRRCDPAQAQQFFAGLHDPFWDHHYTLTSKCSPNRMALIGESRVVEMLANVFFPLLIAEDEQHWNAYADLRASLTNRRVEIAAFRLFGDSPLKHDLLQYASMQQGLLQVYEDFCMQDASDCSECRFPEQLARW